MIKMKLRTKILFIIFSIWLLIFAISYVGSQRIILKSYLEIEHKLALADVNRVGRAIYLMAEGVATTLNSWALWDDAYQFMGDKNTAFIQANLEIPVMASADLDAILFYDQQGKPFFTRMLNLDRTKEINLPIQLTKALQPNGSMWTIIYQPTVYTSATGLFDTDLGVLFMSIHSILTSQGAGPPHGTMIMAKYFTEALLQKLQTVTKLQVEFYRLSELDKTPDIKQIYQQLLTTKNPIIITATNSLVGYKIIEDINGKPIAVIKVTIPRNILAAAVKTTEYFNIAFVILGILFALLLFYLIRFFIISRLEKINEKLIKISSTKDFNLNVPETGKDEITDLGTEVNKMLAMIRKHDEEKQVILSEISHELDNINDINKQIHITQILFDDVLNSMPSELVIVDQDLKIIKMNKIDPKEIQGKHLFDLFPYFKDYTDKLNQSLKNKVTQVIGTITHVKNDTTYYYSVVLFPLVQESHQLLAIRIDDVSSYIRLEDRLIQNDKLASIGQITANVAHEINNPINFIISSISPLKKNLIDIIELLNEYADIKSSKDAKEKLEKIAQTKKLINFDYLITEINQLLDAIKDGTRITIAIVKDLRSFTNLSKEKVKLFDPREGIESTLALLKNKYAGRIEIIKDYDDVPQIEGYTGRINQVYMNLISNAIDAISGKGKIIIKIRKQDDSHIMISIKDSGVGIDENNINKIFDPFFTTKKVGHGTGLGLSIVRTIIQEHQGTINVISHVGEGSEFIIILPIRQSDESKEK